MKNFNTLRTRAAQLGAAVVLTLLFTVSATAYTIVMHGGRRIEIPSQFVVAKGTLTYEISPGFQASLSLAAINIAETERANGETPGSFMSRLQTGYVDPPVQEPVQKAARTITNRDLQASARRRRESEAAYEARIKQLGLTNLEESRRRSATVPDLAPEVLDQIAADRESENYWRSRATDLRTEMAVVDAEIQYVRQRLDELPSNTLAGTTIIGGFPGLSGFGVPGVTFGNFGGNYGGNYGGRRRPNVYASPRTGPQVSGRIGFGGRGTRGRGFPDSRGRFGRRPYGGFPTIGFPDPFFGAGYDNFGQNYDNTYERSELINRFNELSTTRAGFSARWRALEEEARRAGAMPGWLRR